MLEGPSSKKETPARVLFFVPFGSWTVHNQLDAVLATALRSRGAEVAVILCDGLFSNCYVTRNSPNPQAECAHCAASGKQFFSAFNLPQVQLRDYVTPEDFERASQIIKDIDTAELRSFCYKSAPLGELIGATVCSYYRVTWDKLHEPEVVALLRQYLAYAIVAFDGLGRLFDEYQPSHLTLMNGRGYLHSPAYALAETRGVKIVTHERGYFDGSFMLCNDDVAGGFSGYTRIAKAWESIPLTAEEATRVKEYFEGREFGKNLNFHSYYDFTTDPAHVRARLNIPSGAPILSVFTSSEYELLYSWKDYGGVARQMDVVSKLIDLFRSEPELQNSYLVIRHHPSMSFGPTNSPPQTRCLDQAYAQALDAPPNVRVIMPDEPLTSYALLWNSDAGIAFASTLRHEAVARGVPVACADNDFLYQGVPHVIFDESHSGLLELVRALFAHSERFDIDDLRSLYRTANTYFFRHSVQFKSFEIKNNFEPNIKISSLADLAPGKDATLDRICDHVLHNRSIFKLPTREEWSRSSNEEHEFLSAELQHLKETKRKTALAAAEVIRNQRVVDVAVVRYLPQAKKESYFSRWTARQRLRALTVSEVNAHSPSVVERAEQLRKVLSSINEDYVLISCEQFFYEESVLREGVELLGTDHQYDGISWGGWVLDRNGKVKDSIFTRKRPANDYAEAIRLVPNLSDPLHLLSFCLLGREALTQLLDDLCTPGANPAQLIDSFVRSERIIKQLRPQIFVHHVEQQIGQPVTFEHQQPQRTEKLSPDPLQLIESAVAELQKDNNDLALRLLNEAIPLKPDMHILYYARAVAEARLGLTRDAMTSLNVVLAHDSTHEPAKKLLQELLGSQNSP